MEEKQVQEEIVMCEKLLEEYQNKKRQEELNYSQYTEQLSKLAQQYEEIKTSREVVRGSYMAYERLRREVELKLKELKGTTTNTDVIPGQVNIEEVQAQPQVKDEPEVKEQKTEAVVEVKDNKETNSTQTTVNEVVQQMSAKQEQELPDYLK